MKKNKKEYLKPSVVVVLLMSYGNLLIQSLKTFNPDNPDTGEIEDEEIEDSLEIL